MARGAIFASRRGCLGGEGIEEVIGLENGSLGEVKIWDLRESGKLEGFLEAAGEGDD